MEETPMFRTAPSHIYAAMHYDWRSGWSLTVTVPGQEPGSVRSVCYSALSASELVDVLGADLATILAL